MITAEQAAVPPGTYLVEVFQNCLHIVKILRKCELKSLLEHLNMCVIQSCYRTVPPMGGPRLAASNGTRLAIAATLPPTSTSHWFVHVTRGTG